VAAKSKADPRPCVTLGCRPLEAEREDREFWETRSGYLDAVLMWRDLEGEASV